MLIAKTAAEMIPRITHHICVGSQGFEFQNNQQYNTNTMTGHSEEAN
jgi:hypothetical protein